MKPLRTVTIAEFGPDLFRLSADGCSVYWAPSAEPKASAYRRLWNKCERNAETKSEDE